MRLHFEQVYPFDTQTVVSCVIKRDRQSGASFEPSLTDELLQVSKHEGAVPNRIHIPIPAYLRTLFPVSDVEWTFLFTWDPETLTKEWQIKPLAYADRFECRGSTTYVARGEKETLRRATVDVRISVPLGLQSYVENRFLASLVKEADKSYEEILLALSKDDDLPVKSMAHARQRTVFIGDRRIEMTDAKTPGGLSGLAPFWIGTMAVATGAGYFVARSPYRNVVPGIFVLLLIPLFALAFLTVSQARKNSIGVFLALFTVCIVIGSALGGGL